MFIMPKALPEEFRDVVAITGNGEAPITQIALDFDVSPAALHRYMRIANEEGGVRSGALCLPVQGRRSSVLPRTEFLQTGLLTGATSPIPPGKGNKPI